MCPLVHVPTSSCARQFLCPPVPEPSVSAPSSSSTIQFLCQSFPVPKSSVPTSSCPISMDLFLENWWLKTLFNGWHCWWLADRIYKNYFINRSFARFCLIFLPLLRILLDLLNNEIKINRFRSYTSSDKIHPFRWIFLNFQWAFKWSWNSESIVLFPLNFIGIFCLFLLYLQFMFIFDKILSNILPALRFNWHKNQT